MIGIPPAARGVPQIELSFEVDANGILSVGAQNKASGQQQQMKITPSSGLASDEIERMIADAALSADSDRNAKETIALRNRLEGLIRNTQRTFNEFGGVLSPEENADGERALAAAAAAVESQDPDDVRVALIAVERLAGQLTAAMLGSAGV